MTDWPEIREVWDFTDPAASETRFRELAAEAEAAGDDAFAAEAMTQVARTFSLRRQFGDANEVLDAVEAGPAADAPCVRTRVLLERGRTHNSGGDAEAALPLFEEAVSVARGAGEEFLAGDAMHMAGIAADLESEERWLHQLRDYVVQGAEGARYWLGPMHNNLGWTYFFEDRFTDAEQQFRFSREAYASQDGKRMEVLIADYAIGRALRAQSRCREALLVLEPAYVAMEEEFEIEDEYMAEEIALCRADQGDREGAREFARIAHEKFAAQGWFLADEAERLEALRALAED